MVSEDSASITAGPRETRTRPAINPLFRTAAAARGGRVAEDYRDRAQEAMTHSENARRFLLSLQGGLMPARDIVTASVEE